MGVSVKEQLLVFALCIPVGMSVGFLLDWFRVMKSTFRKKTTVWGDAAFFIIAAFFLFGALFWINNGDFRAYEWISIGIGILIYRSFLSRTVLKCSAKILEISGKILRQLMKILLFPLRLFERILRKPIITVIHPAKILGKSISRRYKSYRKEQKRKWEISKKIWKKI